MNRRIILIAMLAGALSGCISGIPVNIDNRSAVELKNVVVSGKGFSESIGSIRAGGKDLVHVRPRVATTVKVEFEAGGRRYSGSTAEELENDTMYTVEVVVDPEMSLSISTPLR